MKTFEYTVKDPEGIHARPAGLLVQEAGRFKSTITLSKAGVHADVKRIFSLMALGVKGGDLITVEAAGPDENPAIEALSRVIRENL